MIQLRNVSAKTGAVYILIFFLFSTVSAYDFESLYKIEIDNKARILGSTVANFAVYNRPDLTVYNNLGKKIYYKKLSNNVKPVLSPDGKTLGLVTYADRNPTDLKTMKFEIFDAAGREVFQMDKPAPHTFFLTDKGTIFGLEGVQGITPIRVYLYDRYGDLINIVTTKENHGLEIAPSGNKFLIDRARNGIDVYDSAGNALASLPAAANYTFDSDDRYLGTFYRGDFRLYQDEKEVVKINSSEISMVDIAVNVENNMAVLLSVKRMEVFELTTGKLLWEYRLVDGEKNYTSVAISPDGKFILSGIDINLGPDVPKDVRHVRGFLYLFSAGGKTLDRLEEKYETWDLNIPRAVFTSSGAFVVETREKVEKFRIK